MRKRKEISKKTVDKYSNNKKIEDSNAVDILGLFLERCPEAARHAGEEGLLPIFIKLQDKD